MCRAGGSKRTAREALRLSVICSRLLGKAGSGRRKALWLFAIGYRLMGHRGAMGEAVISRDAGQRSGARGRSFRPRRVGSSPGNALRRPGWLRVLDCSGYPKWLRHAPPPGANSLVLPAQQVTIPSSRRRLTRRVSLQDEVRYVQHDARVFTSDQLAKYFASLQPELTRSEIS